MSSGGGTAFSFTDGAATITYAGDITADQGQLISIGQLKGGTIAFGGPLRGNGTTAPPARGARGPR